MNKKVTDILVAKAIEQLDNGIAPWQRPWSADSWPHNATTEKAYHGSNVFLLNLRGYAHGAWLTFNQAKARGAMVRKGEHATPIVFWKFLDKVSVLPDGSEKHESIPMLRYFSVFNVEQLAETGDIKTESKATDIPHVDSADAILSGYTDGPTLHHDQSARAFYSPDDDSVHMAARENHVSVSAYYSTLFHELVHSTGHASRLDRISKRAASGNGDYSREELVAEMGAVMLCSIAEVTPNIDNSATYLASWARKLRDDSSLFITASGNAQKAVDRIIA